MNVTRPGREAVDGWKLSWDSIHKLETNEKLGRNFNEKIYLAIFLFCSMKVQKKFDNIYLL